MPGQEGAWGGFNFPLTYLNWATFETISYHSNHHLQTLLLILEHFLGIFDNSALGNDFLILICLSGNQFGEGFYRFSRLLHQELFCCPNWTPFETISYHNNHHLQTLLLILEHFLGIFDNSALGNDFLILICLSGNQFGEGFYRFSRLLHQELFCCPNWTPFETISYHSNHHLQTLLLILEHFLGIFDNSALGNDFLILICLPEISLERVFTGFQDCCVKSCSAPLIGHLLRQ